MSRKRKKHLISISMIVRIGHIITLPMHLVPNMLFVARTWYIESRVLLISIALLPIT